MRKNREIRQRQAMRVGKDKTEPPGKGLAPTGGWRGRLWLSLENPIISC
jgi:hypothetical protein